MRICLLAPRTNAPRSDAILCSQLADGLRRRGHTVVAVTPKPCRRLGEGLLARAAREAAYVPLLARRGLVAGRCDVVIVYSPPLALCAAALVLGAAWRVPIIVWVQDNVSEILAATGAVRSSVVLLMTRAFERLLCRKAARVVAAGVGAVPYADPAKVRIIRNWAS